MLLSLISIPLLSSAEINVTFLSGGITSNQQNEKALAWQIEYENRTTERVGFSVLYLNEGHMTGHKRDGLAGRMKVYTISSTSDFSVSLNAGVYAWTDTQLNTIGRGAAGLLGIDGSYKITKAVFVKTAWNRVVSSDKRDSDIFLVGFGYSWK